MGGVLLPARILFVEFVSNNWFGSLGVITAISMLVIVLAKKQKLGFFGSMLERHMYKFQNGKRGIIVFGESVFLLAILGLMIFTIDHGNSIYSEIQTIPLDSDRNYETKVIKLVTDLSASDWFLGVLMAHLHF